jgi:hypothetical protein
MANHPTFVIVHCSDSPDYPKNHQMFDSVGAKGINQWHIARGWKQIGYHWVIRQSGIVEPGRDETEVGAHCEGKNTGSIGICLVGRGNFQPEQKDALVDLFLAIGKRWNIPLDQWFGHYQFNKNKLCPLVTIDEVKSWLTNPKS